jgi:hypothetical protein
MGVGVDTIKAREKDECDVQQSLLLPYWYVKGPVVNYLTLPTLP